MKVYSLAPFLIAFACSNAPAPPDTGVDAGRDIGATDAGVVDASTNDAPIEATPSCGIGSIPRGLQVSVMPRVTPDRITGSAVVQQSTTSAMTLSCNVTPVDSTDDGVRQLSISSPDAQPLPILPPSSTVWIDVHPNYPPGSLMYGDRAWHFVLRQNQNGPLLFGAALDTLEAAQASDYPLAIAEATPFCTEIVTGPMCGSDAKENVFYSVTIAGDQDVEIAARQRKEVLLGGIGYDVWMVRAEVSTDIGSQRLCPDYHPLVGAWVEYDAIVKNLQDVWQ